MTGDCSVEGQLLAAFPLGWPCSPQDSGLSDPGQGALLEEALHRGVKSLQPLDKKN